MILGSIKSWAELDYSYQLIKILISKLFEQLLNSLVVVIQPPGFNDYSHFFPYISLYTAWKNANLPIGKSIVHNAAHSFMDYVNIWSNHTIFCCSKSQGSNKVNSIVANDVTYQYMFSIDLSVELALGD